MSRMSIEDKIAYLWDKAYTDALGVGHPAPADYADNATKNLRATLRAVERRQVYGDNHPRLGSRAGRAQAASRRGR